MIEQVRELMEEKRLDGVLIQKRNNFSWLTGGRRNHIVLNTPEGVCRAARLKRRPRPHCESNGRKADH
nr:aminopeptidase P family N-terminal domain-containing protein [Bacillus pumilus]